MGKSDNVYFGTRTFWFFRDRANRKLLLLLLSVITIRIIYSNFFM